VTVWEIEERCFLCVFGLIWRAGWMDGIIHVCGCCVIENVGIVWHIGENGLINQLEQCT